MFDVVFAAAAAHGSVTPIMFGDEFRMRSGRNDLWFAGRAHFYRLGFSTPFPRVFDLQFSILVFDFVTHGQGQIWLAIKHSRYRGYGALWHELPNKHHPATPHVR